MTELSDVWGHWQYNENNKTFLSIGSYLTEKQLVVVAIFSLSENSVF